LGASQHDTTYSCHRLRFRGTSAGAAALALSSSRAGTLSSSH
jgi:hypothetical protein